MVSKSTIMLLSATRNPALDVPLTKDADIFTATSTSLNRKTTNYSAEQRNPDANVCWIKNYGCD